jgi:hypothetical protein
MIVRAIRLIRRDYKSLLLLFRMAAWIVALSAMVKFLPLPTILKIIDPQVSRAPMSDPQALQQRLTHCIDRLLSTNRLVFTPTCWKRATVLYRYLALNGIRTRIVFGLSKKGEGLLAGHAWLEADGKPFLESKNPEFTVTYSFPA